MYHMNWSRKTRQTIIKTIVLLSASIFLVGCGTASPETTKSPETTIAATTPLTSASETAAPAPEFEGLVGQDWYEVKVPLFGEVGSVRDLAYGAGRLWAAGIQTGVNDESFRTPALLTSSDGLHWEQVDLLSLGVPENLSGEARLLGTDESIIVVFENQDGDDAFGDLPQRRPWVLRGDGENWRVIGDQEFGPWQVDERTSGKYLHYWDLKAFAEHKGELVLMPSIGWHEPYSTSNFNFGLGHITADDEAELIADFDLLRSPYQAQVAAKMLVFQDEYLVFASSFPSRDEGGGLYFNLWRSEDGRNWVNETPDFEGRLDFTNINDAVIGPKGMLAVGWQAKRQEDSEYSDASSPIALLSVDGSGWTASTFGGDYQDGFQVTATGSDYYAYVDGAHIWHSADGVTWDELEPVTRHIFTSSKEWVADPGSISVIPKMIGFPEGLIALNRGGSLLFSGRLPYDYLNQK